MSRIASIGFVLFILVSVFTISVGALEAEVVRGPMSEEGQYLHERALWGFDAEHAVPAFSWVFGSLAAAVACFAQSTRLLSLRFEIAFWSGIVLLASACRCCWLGYLDAASYGAPGSLERGYLLWPVPMIAAYATFLGLLAILWAIHANDQVA